MAAARPAGGGGIIPARAGFTRAPFRLEIEGGDHPRSRGVYRMVLSEQSKRDGSSPLARGLLLQVRDHGRKIRIIPARAGFTCTHQVMPQVAAGSSPLARGLHIGVLMIAVRIGIIPARAGFT